MAGSLGNRSTEAANHSPRVRSARSGGASIRMVRGGAWGRGGRGRRAVGRGGGGGGGVGGGGVGARAAGRGGGARAAAGRAAAEAGDPARDPHPPVPVGGEEGPAGGHPESEGHPSDLPVYV